MTSTNRGFIKVLYIAFLSIPIDPERGRNFIGTSRGGVEGSLDSDATGSGWYSFENSLPLFYQIFWINKKASIVYPDARPRPRRPPCIRWDNSECSLTGCGRLEDLQLEARRPHRDDSELDSLS